MNKVKFHLIKTNKLHLYPDDEKRNVDTFANTSLPVWTVLVSETSLPLGQVERCLSSMVLHVLVHMWWYVDMWCRTCRGKRDEKDIGQIQGSDSNPIQLFSTSPIPRGALWPTSKLENIRKVIFGQWTHLSGALGCPKWQSWNIQSAWKTPNLKWLNSFESNTGSVLL